MAEANIKTGPALFRDILFALFTFGLGLLMMSWITNPLQSIPLWLDRLSMVVFAIGLGLIVRRILLENQFPSGWEMVFSAIWAVITYSVSGLLVGTSAGSQLLEALGVHGSILLVGVAVIIVCVITLNGFTFTLRAITVWTDVMKLPFWGGIILLWLLAMGATWVGTMAFHLSPFNWFFLGIYWFISIALTGGLRAGLDSPQT